MVNQAVAFDFVSAKQQLWIERVIAFIPLIFALVAIVCMFSDVAMAGLPWEGPLCKVANSLRGPVAKGVAVIAIVICGLMMALGEMGGVFKTMLGLLMGTSMALLASSWLGLIDGSTFNCSEF